MIDEQSKVYLKKFGEKLAQMRRAKNLSFRKMALKCDIDFSNIKKMEKGEINITLLTLTELAKALEVDPKELLDFNTL